MTKDKPWSNNFTEILGFLDGSQEHKMFTFWAELLIGQIPAIDSSLWSSWVMLSPFIIYYDTRMS